MESLDQVCLFCISKFLILSDLLNFCLANRKINRLIYHNNAIWIFRLNKDFPNRKHIIDLKPLEVYKLLTNLTKLIKRINYKGSSWQLYHASELNLFWTGLTVIPLKIGILRNLKILYLHHNQIKELPSEIFKLTNLQYLLFK